MASTVLPDIEGFDSSQLQQILNDLDSQTLKAGKTKLPPISFSSEDERLKLEQGLHKAKRALIDVKRLEATSHLVHGDFDAAAIEAGRALKLSLDVFGPGKIELVSCHLLLAEANLGLGRQKFTAEYLARANWCILKNPDCSNRLKSQLYRNFGKLYASQGKYDEALRQLANDIYFSSLQSGPEHVETAGGYYYMATVFYLQSKIDSALGMCDKVVEIWMKEGKKSSPTTLSESQIMEGVQVISKIVVLREEALGIDHVATGEACFVLGLLYNHAKEPGKARGLIGKASKIYQQELGASHPTTIDCVGRLQSLGANVGIAAPSHSNAAAASTPVPQLTSKVVQEDASHSAGLQCTDPSTSNAPSSEIVGDIDAASAAAASAPSSTDTVADGPAFIGDTEETTSAVSQVDTHVEVASDETPILAESVDADGVDAPQPADNSTSANASVGDPIAPPENESGQSSAAQNTQNLSEEAARDDGNSVVTAEVAASLEDAATIAIVSDPAPSVEEDSTASSEAPPVIERNRQDAAIVGSAVSEIPDA
jgi:tetratricopeptide (TPR) repeat protein